MIRLLLRWLQFSLGIILSISVANAERQMIPSRFGITVPFLTPEELRSEIYGRGANNIRIETSLRHLRDLDQWPSGYREIVEDFALHPDKAKTHTFSSRDWTIAVEALHAQKKHRGEPISAELARKISVKRVYQDIIGESEYPRIVSLLQLDDAIKSDPLLEQSLAANLDSPVSAVQRKRLTPHVRKQVVASLGDITKISYQSAGEIGNLIRKFDLKGDDIDRLFAEAIQTSYVASDALMIEALRPKSNGEPSEVLLSKRFQQALAQSNVGPNKLFELWKSHVKTGGDALVRHISGLPGWKENKVLHRFVAKIATGTDLDTFRESVRVLDGTDERFYEALYDPEKVDWLFDNRPDLVDSMFPNFKFLRAKAGWRVDADLFAKIINQQMSLDSRDVLILTRHIEELSRNRTLLPEQLNSWQRFIESKLKGDAVSSAARRALVESVRRLKIWSPQIEKSLVSWVANDRLNIVNPNSNSPVIALKSAIGALVEAQARGQLTQESEELMVSGIKPPIDESTRNALSGRRRQFSELFYSSLDDNWNLIEPWLDLVKGMKSSSALETELRKILDAFYWTQSPLPKRPGADLESPFLFDENTIRKVFAIIEERPVLSESFRAYLKILLGDPKMRRAFYEYAPSLISKYDLPITEAMRADIDRLKAAREFQATDQLKFHRSGPAASTWDFLRKLALSTGSPDNLYELPTTRDRSEQVGPAKIGKSAEVVLFPSAATQKATGTAIMPQKLAELDGLTAIEAWTNSILGESRFDRQLFPQDLTESEVAFARIDKFLADRNKSRGQAIENLLKSKWPLTADVLETLSKRFPSFVLELMPEEKAKIVNGILMGEIPNQPLAKSLVAPLTHQLASELPSAWKATGRAAFKSPADFRIASAMLHTSSSDIGSFRFFDLISKSDLNLSRAEFLRVRDVLQTETLNPEDQTRLRNRLSVEFGAVLRRSDFLQGGPAKATLAISLLEMADVDTPEIQSALAARKGAVTSLFFQTPRSTVPAPNTNFFGLGSLKVLINGCADAYRELKQK